MSCISWILLRQFSPVSGLDLAHAHSVDERIGNAVEKQEVVEVELVSAVDGVETKRLRHMRRVSVEKRSYDADEQAIRSPADDERTDDYQGCVEATYASAYDATAVGIAQVTRVLVASDLLG